MGYPEQLGEIERHTLLVGTQKQIGKWQVRMNE
jgi:hypothetical protein